MKNKFIYPVNNNAVGAYTLSKKLWGFHDFRISKINYDASLDRIDLILEYDSDNFRILLRFEDDIWMNFHPTQDFAADWLLGATLLFDSSKRFLWVEDDSYSENDPLPEYAVWIKSKKLSYAAIDLNDNPIEFPNYINKY